MAGRGFAPKPERRRRNAPIRGEWKASPGLGWQHGPVPDAPAGLRQDSAATWTAWMRSWAAANWQPADLPGLTVTIQLWDQCQAAFEDPYIEKDGRKGETMFVLRPNPTTELRQYMDNYGISPKGQQDRRWVAPKVEDPPDADAAPATSPYAGLRVVNE